MKKDMKRRDLIIFYPKFKPCPLAFLCLIFSLLYIGLINLLDSQIDLKKKNHDLDEFYEELIEQHKNPNRPKSMEGDILDLLLQLKKEQSTPIDLTLDDIKGILMVISHVLNPTYFYIHLAYIYIYIYITYVLLDTYK
ncbi:hypothetical protein MTR67_018951 [Solanum verrucosum]|uniref:Uncharacterized protein n=1 Tax=Solanum verrucosum TaxID=315347 RepID=A0AAF0TMV0_SOLVR|nr:hypothetical protein MTR67_018951 [Solanum verrucosum]